MSWHVERRQADICAKIVWQISGNAGAIPPGSNSGAEDREQPALLHRIGDREFKAQHDAALGKRVL
jgi:hypothetical protein